MQSYPMSHVRASVPFSLLVSLRWIALAGQSMTVIIIDWYFGMNYPKGITWSIIALSTIVNFVLTLTYRTRHKIPPGYFSLYLIYDIGQLAALLYVTGGLNNPFSVFLLAPVVIAAGFLRRQDAFLVTGVGVLATFILYTSVFPLPWYEMGLVLPVQLQFAVLVGICCAMIFTSIYVGKVATGHLKAMEALRATELALAREQKLASLGALAAAAAHELGSPLTTIMLVVKELQNDKSLQDDIKEEVKVLGEQTSRCREILQGLSRNFAKEHVLPFKSLPLPAALEVVIANQNQQAGTTVRVVCDHDAPVVELTPELQHALANIISNAIQFACSAVVVTCAWNDRELKITIADDGKGYPEYILARIGEPYISSRTDSAEGVHLGLGLFIAQSLIVKKGGVVYFYNKNGAVCEIVLPRNAVEVHS